MIENTATRDKLVLIAEDHADIGDLLRTMVEDLVGARAAVAADGEEAVALAGQLGPDLILLDLADRVQGQLFGCPEAATVRDDQLSGE